MGGVFFAFSTFVMDGLRRLPPAQGIAAMQSIMRRAEPGLHDRAVGTSLLATVGPQSAEAAGRWARYASTWTSANHVRAAAALAAAAALTIGLRVA